MRILWKCNLPIRSIAEKEKLDVSPFGGWIEGLYKSVIQNQEITLGICFPYQGKKIQGVINGVEYFSFSDLQCKNKNIQILQDEFETILQKFSPDIVHIFGTEYIHTYALVNAFKRPERTILQIQGLVSVCAKHYMAGLPLGVQYGTYMRELYYRKNLIAEKKQFEMLGAYEVKAICNVKHIIGRTDWDRACTEQINRDARYYQCNENLRDSFYDNEWKLAGVMPHMIFVSQCNYPLKGFHYVVEALAILKKKYKDVKLVTTGEDFCVKKSYKRSAYQKYLYKLIKKYDLFNNIEFVGQLNEQQMKDMYMKANVFVSASSIENSSNSIGEAMLLGAPVVSSYVGGISSLLEHGKEGYMYQVDAPYMMAHYIEKVFDDKEKIKEISKATRKRAKITHNREKNTAILMKIYQDVMKDKFNE